jgi:hypothetical protein
MATIPARPVTQEEYEAAVDKDAALDSGPAVSEVTNSVQSSRTGIYITSST